MSKKVVFSAIQPSGTPTLGNYLGALKNWSDMKDEYDCTFAVADLHAITVRQNPADLKRRTLEMYALLFALGLNNENSTVFVQSHVPAHTGLSWVLSCYSSFGEMSRMTQFKDKSQKHSDNVNVGLFSYPVLMVADILLYNAEFVPVGKDQNQHLEITRDIAERFNGIYGDVFTIPDSFKEFDGAKIMSLTDPTKKMSKSDDNLKSFISLTDTPSQITKKIKSAVTDSDGEVVYREGKDGVNNLLTIYSCCTGKTIKEAEKEFEGVLYGDFKQAVAESVVKELDPLLQRYNEYVADKQFLEKQMKIGAEKAAYVANKTLKKVMKKVGFYNI
ncbi:MAG: tryptophan--tRNA ligase [Clostridia bacterium]|nr:tryptophan--tRNA ligase [Clostridia bacterium]